MAFKTLTGLWESEKGYLSGKSNEPIAIPANVKLFIFKKPAKDRKTDKHPTHSLCIAVDDEQSGGGGQWSQEATSEPF